MCPSHISYGSNLPYFPLQNRARAQNVIMSSAIQPWLLWDKLLDRYADPITWQSAGDRRRIWVRWRTYTAPQKQYEYFWLDELNNTTDPTKPWYQYVFTETPWYEIAYPHTAYGRNLSEMDFPIYRKVEMAFSVVGGDSQCITDIYSRDAVAFSDEIVIQHNFDLSLYGKYPKVPVVQIWDSGTRELIQPDKMLLPYRDPGADYGNDDLKILFLTPLADIPTGINVRIAGGDSKTFGTDKIKKVSTRLLTNPVAEPDNVYRYEFYHGLEASDEFPLFQLMGTDFVLIWPYRAVSAPDKLIFFVRYNKPIRAVAMA